MAALVALAVAVVVAPAVLADDPAPRFSSDVQPIFDAKCTSCHPVSYPYLDLRRGHSYGDLVRVSAATRPAFERVLPGRPELSYLLIHPPDPSLRGLLGAEDRKTIAAWIQAGASND
jgi:hypothetical protein